MTYETDNGEFRKPQRARRCSICGEYPADSDDVYCTSAACTRRRDYEARLRHARRHNGVNYCILDDRDRPDEFDGCIVAVHHCYGVEYITVPSDILMLHDAFEYAVNEFHTEHTKHDEDLDISHCELDSCLTI